MEALPSSSDDPLGFTRVIDYVSKLKKPLIGHNGILDLMFMYDKFYRPLPDTQLEFKTAINALFPHIYDTSHMISVRSELKQVFPYWSLGDVYRRVLRPDFSFD